MSENEEAGDDNTGDDEINNIIKELESVIDEGRELLGEGVRRSGRETRPVDRYTYSQVLEDRLKVNYDRVIMKNAVETAMVMVAVIEGLYIKHEMTRDMNDPKNEFSAAQQYKEEKGLRKF